ncbi:MAG: hypothetical protein ABIG61_02755 [Planctomycetota bacterium]
MARFLPLLLMMILLSFCIGADRYGSLRSTSGGAALEAVEDVLIMTENHEPGYKPLRDGFVFAGVDGKLIQGDQKDRWFFQLYSDIKDDKGLIKAGLSLEMFPSSTLQKILQDHKTGSTGSYRLWGRVACYNNKNYIFPAYFLPITEVEAENASEGKNEIKINEPNDAVTLPEDVLAMLRPKRVVSLATLRKALQSKKDFMLVDRTGLLEIATDSDEAVLRLDGLGRKLEDISFPLLRCQALQNAQETQKHYLEKVRFNVTGIVTVYNDKHYLLLQKADMQFNNGNFAR